MKTSSRRSTLKILILTAASGVWTACQQVAAEVTPVPTLAEVGHIQAQATAQATRQPAQAATDAPPAGDTPTPALVEATDEAPEEESTRRAWPSVERGPEGILLTAPLQAFYDVRYRNASPRPEIDEADWTLTIEGWVDDPVTLTLDDIQAMEPVDQMRTLECISNPVGGTLMGNTNWRGVRMVDVLDMAGVRGGGRFIKFTAEDGYETGIPIDLAQHPDALLVYEMNGEALPVKHGYPLRVLLPGRYGQKQPKWITHIEVLTSEFIGYWETQGWSNEATVQINSQIWEPSGLEETVEGAVTISGIAYADDSGVASVEVSLDGGVTWQQAELVKGPSNLVWTEWRLTAELTADRSPYRLSVRAVDGSGSRQRSTTGSGILSGTYPDGTSDIHETVISVSST